MMAGEEKSTRSPSSPTHDSVREVALSRLMVRSRGLELSRVAWFLNIGQLMRMLLSGSEEPALDACVGSPSAAVVIEALAAASSEAPAGNAVPASENCAEETIRRKSAKRWAQCLRVIRPPVRKAIAAFRKRRFDGATLLSKVCDE